MASMFPVSIGSNVPELQTVTPEIVRTSEGRSIYAHFLKGHPNLTPLQQLYGLAPPSNLNSEEVRAHVRLLSLCVHPDKVPEREKALCNGLFQAVRKAAREYENPQGGSLSREFTPFPFGSTRSFAKQIVDCIEERRWLQAKALIQKHPDKPLPPILVSIVNMYTDDLPLAIEKMPSHLPQTKGLLTAAWRAIEASKSTSQANAKDVTRQLLSALQGMQQLPAVYTREEREENQVSLTIFNHVVPHKLFIGLKECARLLQSDLEYERHLRNAIRYCPDGLENEKGILIKELQGWLKAHYKEQELAPLQLDREMKIQARFLCADLMKDLMRYSGPATGLLNQAIDHFQTFIQDEQCHSLTQAIQKLQEIVQGGSVVSSWIPPLGYFCAYSTQIQEALAPVLHRMRGLEAYLQKQLPQAASSFLQGKDDLCLGLMRMSLHQYRLAIQSWEEFLSRSSDRAKENLAAHAASYLFLTMNVSDTLYVAETSRFPQDPLGEVNEKQLEVMQTRLQE